MLWLGRFFRQDLGIDLGTANTVIAVAGMGVVLNEPSVVALEKDSKRRLVGGSAVGKLARQMLGKTPQSMSAAKPLSRGVITDYRLCEAMLLAFMKKLRRQTRRSLIRPRVLVSAPIEMTAVERRALFNTIERCGASRSYLISKAKAAAIGAGLPISEPVASMICDLGSGTTEIAIFSLGDAVSSRTCPVAGDDLDRAIADYLKKNYALRIGLPTAEQLKLDIGSAVPLSQELSSEVRGLDIISGVPRRAFITSEDLREAITEPLSRIVAGIRETIEACQPELVADLAETGIVLTGCAARLRGLDQLLTDQLGIVVRIDDEPESATVRGMSICLDHFDEWKQQFLTDLRDA
jgi:rod shape-determining protein MreB